MSDPGNSPDEDSAPMPPAGSEAAPTDGASDPKVLLTVLDNGDGTFQLVEGDEDDGDASGAGAAPGDMSGGASAQQGTTYDSLGALLKGVMDCVKKAQSGGDGTDEANFNDGFTGGSNASPAKPPAPAAMA